MKRKLVLCIMGLLLLAGCGTRPTAGLSEGTYRALTEDGDLFSPAISFDLTHDTFTFSYDVLSSYLPTGSIEIKDDRVTAATGDGRYTYIFQIIDNDTIAFVQKGSAAVRPIMADSALADGTEFKFVDD